MSTPGKAQSRATKSPLIAPDGNREAAEQPRANVTQPDPRTQAVIEEKLRAARDAAHQGQWWRAYQLSVEVTKLAPNNVNAWLYRAALTENSEDRMAYLSRALSLAPQNVQAGRGMYGALSNYLEDDPFLRYLEENDVLYRVETGEGQIVVVPKERATTRAYPFNEPHSLRVTYRWLAYSTLGLLLAGLGTLVCAPVAASFAWQASHEPLSRSDTRRARFALAYALVLWTLGLMLSFLFLLHL
jgi:hypothetical protein